MVGTRILVFHTGSLGDTLVAIPALCAVRENFPDAHITMLTDDQPRRVLIQAGSILDGSGLIDDYLFYNTENRLAVITLFLRLRLNRFDTLIYLIRNYSNDNRASRDKLFFKLAGIKRIIGLDGFDSQRGSSDESPSGRVPHIVDVLLNRLTRAGLHIAPKMNWMHTLKLGEKEFEEVNRWSSGLPFSGGRRLIAVGIGGKMPVNRWPIERYAELISNLIETEDVWPIIFGGPENSADGQNLINRWKRGYLACGNLGIRASIAAMSRCTLFIGNDTGTIHMAAAAGVTCVGVYSSRNLPGLWDPYGVDHVVIRKHISCEGCMLEDCIEKRMECILSISVQQVLDACLDLLS